ncbi:alpha/beta-hydrolase [Trametes coccinea BRFM310]|uniref:Alpha/beta-hydrolase n=1 Tax=Trametes coccinea (strain BRFM310) TaxID=1353009 RepID=A0A1Y2J454_TRAC3|nr:alpha/beta-hydrolase [Trametes coccinea BRFM310]
MPTAPVDHEGTVLYYEDSGIPAKSANYVTLVLIHGTCFHSAVYRPMLPFAAEHNLRLVLLNLRGYPGSTDYSPADLDKLRDSDPESQEQAMAERGLEIAEFLRWYIDTEAIPPITLTPEGVSTGGISLLSWSGGNWFTVAMFGNAGTIPESTRKLLNTYLRSFVMFDPSSTVIGHSIPPGLSSLRRDASAPVDEQVAIFAVDVSAYYPPYEIPDDIDPPPTFDVPRRPLHEASAEINPKYAPTSTKMSPETLRDLTHSPIMKEYQHVLWGVNREVLKTNLHRALYDCRVDDGTGMRKPIWPDVLRLGRHEIIRAGHQKANPEHRRDMQLHMLKNANHFVHWEEPERFIKFLTGIV